MNFKAFQIKYHGYLPLLSKEIKLSLIVLLLLLLLHQSLINIGSVKVFESSGIFEPNVLLEPSHHQARFEALYVGIL